MSEEFKRPCALGSHWVSTHRRRVQPSGKNPNGYTVVDGHCRRNPSHKQMILPEELKYVEEKYFFENLNPPSPQNLGYGKAGNSFDALIGGWTKFWNDVFKPETPLDPDIVKALIASESSFNPNIQNPSNDGEAMGLMQVTMGTMRILKSEKGELSDFLVKVTKHDLKDPSINIAAGTRWLFRKRETARARLGRGRLGIRSSRSIKESSGRKMKRRIRS